MELTEIDIHGEVDFILAKAMDRQTCIVTLGSLTLFSTETGDAWMLDTDDGLALRLAQDGVRLPARIQETEKQFAIEWTASYRIDGEGFVITERDSGRTISFFGYPTVEIASAHEQAHGTLPASVDRAATLSMLQDIPPWAWTGHATNTILDILQDDSATTSDRLVAVRLAAQIVGSWDEVAAVLLGICRNSDASGELRGQAAIALGPSLEQGYTMGFEDEQDLMLSEAWFRQVTESFRELYADADIPDSVRRRVLEAAVRAPDDWQRDAIRAAYSSEERHWRVTAVFCMRFVDGFNREILESLDSPDSEIHYQAVCAAGNWGVDAAWSHLVRLLTDDEIDKHLLLAAIDAIANIRPAEAGIVLVDLLDADDEDIVEAVHEAMTMAEMMAGDSESNNEACSDDDNIGVEQAKPTLRLTVSPEEDLVES